MLIDNKDLREQEVERWRKEKQIMNEKLNETLLSLEKLNHEK